MKVRKVRKFRFRLSYARRDAHGHFISFRN